MNGPTAYERRKAPEKVRAALIESAAKLIADQGLTRLTIDAVAKAAGVTKGGLFHHFASKNELIQGVLDAMTGFAENAMSATMTDDPEPHGRFTRAYLAGVLSDSHVAEQTTARTLCLAMLADPTLQERWFEWVRGQVAKHAATDDNVGCHLVRLAADGIWLNSLRQAARPPDLPPRLIAKLIALTRPDR